MSAPAYTNNLSSDIGRIRLAIGDNRFLDKDAGIRPRGAHLRDDEINQFLAIAGNDWQIAVPLILRALATEWSVYVQSLALEGEYREEYAKTAELLGKRADDYEKAFARLPANVTLDYSGAFGYQEGAPRLFGTKQYGAQIADVAE